ncbi:MAG: DAK2 domain-containing protein [Lachnospiraceae bacterium]|nr:DAK2 domain-containing protein [Lachnospiraceae bacterium]
MAEQVISAALLKKMFLAGVTSLDTKKEWINELNVFPVPDGDTGTNMTLTIMSAAKEVMALPMEPAMEALAKAISSGSLRGARGNSGVILSQLFRGFTKEIRQCEEIDVPRLAAALQRAAETAYKAVMKPKEGTILTVARGIAEKAIEIAATETDMDHFIQELLKEGDYVLSQTPEMLPVLKQAGVVDSGGQGLMVVLKGCYEGYLGKEVAVDFEKPAAAPSEGTSLSKAEIDTADIKFGYCTEFIIMTERTFTMDDEISFKEYLSSIGDSIVCVADDEIVKVHVHTNDPGLAIQRALTYGQLTRMKIDNMREEHQERVIKDAEKLAAEQAAKAEAPVELKEYGFISVSAGSGLSEIFRGLGVDYVIEGGQTMNPSTEDMLNAVANVHAKNIFILPNNSNIILAANQAKNLVEDKEIFVIPTKTVPQGITAMINFTPDKSMEENAQDMIEEIRHVKTGQVTYAVRDTVIDGIEIHKDDIIGLGDKTILADGKEITEVTFETIKAMVDEDSELVGIYYGAGITEEQAEELAERLSEEFPSVDVEINEGGQPIYYYILSVE